MVFSKPASSPQLSQHIDWYFSADNAVVYPWGDHKFYGCHHYASIIQIGFGPLCAFNSWKNLQGIANANADDLSLDNNLSKDMNYNNSIV